VVSTLDMEMSAVEMKDKPHIDSFIAKHKKLLLKLAGSQAPAWEPLLGSSASQAAAQQAELAKPSSQARA
jgi:hypothetical protein